MFARRWVPASTGGALQQVLKERSPSPVCDPVDRCVTAASRDAC